MNLNRVASLGKVALKARTIWLAFLAGVFVGWMMCFAWVLVLSYAPQVALSLIDGLH